jgi:hypothetical protein
MATAMNKGGLIADYVLGKAPRTQEQYLLSQEVSDISLS